MKRWAGLLLLAYWPLAGAVADDALSQVMRSLAAVPAVEAAFREEKTLAALDAPLVATGVLYYRAPDFLRKQTLHPQPEDYEADGNWLTVETPDAGRRQFDLNGYPQLRPFVEAIRAAQAGDRAALERYYQLEFQGMPADWSLRLTPRDADAQRYVAAIVLRGQNGRIVSMETLEPNGDRGLMTITPR
ncbi:MAG: LolA-related protein [Candidatus Contendobacter sp.]